MGARTRLNEIYVFGCIGVAALIGALVGGWPIFVVALAVLIGLCLHSGDIRPRPGPRR
jgi:hypothetical protein